MIVSEQTKLDKPRLSWWSWIGIGALGLCGMAYLAWATDNAQTKPLTDTRSVNELVRAPGGKISVGAQCFSNIDERNAAWLRILVDIDRQTWARDEGLVPRHGGSAIPDDSADAIPGLRPATNEDLTDHRLTNTDLCFVVTDDGTVPSHRDDH